MPAMNSFRLSTGRLAYAPLVALVFWGLAPSPAPAQSISLKTVPIATGDQFLLFPSRNLGMGSVSIALDDPTLDPFVNPAKGSRVRGAQIFTAPVFYTLSEGNGAGRSLPAGVLFGAGSWFGAAALSFQELDFADRGFVPIVELGSDGAIAPLAERGASNVYAFAMAGRRLRGSKTSIAGSVFWAGLDAMEGVDLLYAGSDAIEQWGHLLDVRLGLLGELEGDRFYEVVALYSGLDMTHEVTYKEGGWDAPAVRVEKNFDRTDTWGVHVGYVHPLAQDGWRVGGIFTMNYKSHPKIPNYELMDIPRDPGNSWAFNLGIGVARATGESTFGLDLILEPAWSDTWAVADGPVPKPGGGVVPSGWKTVENAFRFTNARLRLGFGMESERAAFQLGLQVYSVDYRLEQVDHVREEKRTQQESWLEWTPSLGLTVKLPELEVRYVGRVTTGTGRPGIATRGFVGAGERTFSASSDMIIAPRGPLTLQEADVVTHQLSVVIPIQ
jgi:hypothetical protein